MAIGGRPYRDLLRVDTSFSLFVPFIFSSPHDLLHGTFHVLAFASEYAYGFGFIKTHKKKNFS